MAVGSAKKIIKLRGDIAQRELAATGKPEHALRDHRVAGRIGMDDPSTGIREEKSSRNPIEGVAERGGPCCCVVKFLSNKQRSTHMAGNQLQATPSHVVHDAVSPIAHEAQMHKIRG